MGDYIYVNTKILIYRKNILTGEVIEKSWGTTGNIRERDGFARSDKKCFFWKDGPGTQNLLAKNILGTKKWNK